MATRSSDVEAVAVDRVGSDDGGAADEVDGVAPVGQIHDFLVSRCTVCVVCQFGQLQLIFLFFGG